MNDDKIIREYPDFTFQYSVPKHMFGEEDANVEWKNPAESVRLFFHTESYEEFRLPTCLYLFGRRGSGKTSLIRMLDHETNNNKESQYLCSYIVDEEDAYKELTIQLRSSPFRDLPMSELVHLIVKKWSWIILTASMVAVLRKSSAEGESDEDLETIKKFLTSQEEVGDEIQQSVWSRIVECVDTSLAEIDYAPAKLGLAISRISKRLFSTEFNKARTALLSYLEKKNSTTLIMIDSIEVYELRDPIAEAVATALIETIRRFNTKVEFDRIVLKAAFPSEIYPRLKPLNKEKVEGNNLFILWKYRDLLCLLAKRYFHHFGDSREKVNLKDLDDYETAREFLYSHMPSTITCEQGIEFDTLAYIIRHSQKKPRQMIVLLNVIHTLAEQVDIDLRRIPSQFINRGVHARLDLIVEGSFEVFEQIFRNASVIVKRVLHDMPSCFNYSMLTKKLPEANTLRAEANLTREDVIRLLLESGALGVKVNNGREIGEGVQVVEAFFEYQVKGVLQISNASSFVVHPMLYQAVNTRVDLKKYIYPVPLETEEKDLIASMKLIVK